MNYRDHDFEYKGKPYKIRVSQEGENYTVRALLDGRPVNPYVRSLTAEQASNLLWFTGANPLESFIEEARTDIREDRWEKLQAILKNPPKL